MIGASVFVDVDRALMWMLLGLLIVIGILGATSVLDLDDASHRYPEPIPVPTFQINPVYNHPEQP